MEIIQGWRKHDSAQIDGSPRSAFCWILLWMKKVNVYIPWHSETRPPTGLNGSLKYITQRQTCRSNWAGCPRCCSRKTDARMQPQMETDVTLKYWFSEGPLMLPAPQLTSLHFSDKLSTSDQRLRCNATWTGCSLWVVCPLRKGQHKSEPEEIYAWILGVIRIFIQTRCTVIADHKLVLRENWYLNIDLDVRKLHQSYSVELEVRLFCLLNARECEPLLVLRLCCNRSYEGVILLMGLQQLVESLMHLIQTLKGSSQPTSIHPRIYSGFISTIKASKLQKCLS